MGLLCRCKTHFWNVRAQINFLSCCLLNVVQSILLDETFQKPRVLYQTYSEHHLRHQNFPLNGFLDHHCICKFILFAVIELHWRKQPSTPSLLRKPNCRFFHWYVPFSSWWVQLWRLHYFSRRWNYLDPILLWYFPCYGCVHEHADCYYGKYFQYCYGTTNWKFSQRIAPPYFRPSLVTWFQIGIQQFQVHHYFATWHQSDWWYLLDVEKYARNEKANCG